MINNPIGPNVGYGYSYQYGAKTTKTTTVYEYDEEGRVIRETVTVEETTPQYTYHPTWYTTTTPYITHSSTTNAIRLNGDSAK